MSMFDVFDISGSAMTAQSLRMNLTASNLANADSVAGSAAEAYKSRQPVFAAEIENQMLRNETGAGVNLKAVVESQAAHPMRYSPNNPFANEEGYVFEANVDFVEEMTNMISASRSYQNNIEVMNTSKQMLLKTLTLGD